MHLDSRDRAQWPRSGIGNLRENDVLFERCSQGNPRGGRGSGILVEGNITTIATRYKRPLLTFPPNKVFAEPCVPHSSAEYASFLVDDAPDRHDRFLKLLSPMGVVDFFPLGFDLFFLPGGSHRSVRLGVGACYSLCH